MPRLAFKRKPADEHVSLSAYLPTQMVDYTSLPPIEEDTALMRFARLPLPARISAVLLPVLLIGAALWGTWQYLDAPEPVKAEAPPRPAIKISDARVVGADAVMVEAEVTNVADGAVVSGQLLSNDQPLAWADAEKSVKPVQNGKVALRIVKAETGAPVLDESAAYAVELKLGGAADTVAAQLALTVPEKLKADFFAKPQPTPEPTLEPTPQPTLEPTPEPTPEPATLTVAVDSALRLGPAPDADTVATVQPGATFEPMLRSADNRWFLVQQEGAVGWLSADDVKLDAERSARVPLVTPDPAAVAAGPNKATVFNGGNIRYLPNTETGTVLGQLHAGQSVTLKQQTADGEWFLVVAPEAQGWVNVSLLTIKPGVAEQVQVSEQ